MAAVLDVARSWKDLVEAAEQNRVLGPLQTVNDPLYRHQWALGRIQAEPAWHHVSAHSTSAAPGVVVAILDSGIRVGHPDLAGHLLDDGLGHFGINLLNGTFNVFDTDGHGTQLAGVIGAVSNDAKGIAAAAWPIQLMAVKFLDIRNPPTALSGTIAIWWAALKGAKVITTAWGVGLPSMMLLAAFAYASLKGAVVIAAAGNDGLDNDLLPTYPASYGGPPHNLPNSSRLWRPSSCRRGMQASYDDKARFSNYGLTRVHLAAPGIGVLSTDTHFGTERWKPYSGTSAACAHVTYAAAYPEGAESRVESDGHPGPPHSPPSIPSPWLGAWPRDGSTSTAPCEGPFVITALWLATSGRFRRTPPVTWTNRYQTPLATSVRVLLSVNEGP